MGLFENVVSNQIEKRQNVTSQAVQLQNYCTEHEQDLKDSKEGRPFVLLDSTEIWGDFVMPSDQKAIAKRLGMDSDGYFTITANHTEFVLRYEEQAGIVMIGYKGGDNQSSSSSVSNNFDDYDDSDDEDYKKEQKHQKQIQQKAEKKEEENKAREMVREIDSLPISPEDIVMQIKECSSCAQRDTFSTKLANQMVKNAWIARGQKLRAYADTHCADDPLYTQLVVEEKAKKEAAEQKAKELKAKKAAEKAEKERLKKEREEKEQKEEAHSKKVNRICWLTWLGLTVFFLCMGDPFDYDWYHYVLVVLASIVSAVVLIVKWMFQ